MSEELHAVGIEREMRTEACGSERLLLTAVADNLFRVEETSFLTGAVYRDVINATETDDGAVVFVEIAEHSPLVTKSWILSQQLLQSDALQRVLHRGLEKSRASIDRRRRANHESIE